MNNLKVSIIIPVYNGEKYIEKAINSALKQTYNNIEVIVVNDGSVDNTEQICKSYGKKIKYFKKENGGVSSALNVGIKNMTGEYFSWLSHDDLYFPEKIEKQIAYLNKLNMRNVILYSDYWCMDKNEKLFSEPCIIDKDLVDEKPLYALLRGFVNGITLLIPREAFNKCGYFDESLRCTQDYDLWWRMFKEYDFLHMQELITKTRIHKNQDTKKSPVVITEGNELWKRMIEDVPDNVKVQYEGSVYNYYYEMANFLQTTPYNEAKKFCINKCMIIDKKKYLKKPIKKPSYRFKGIIKYTKNHGIISTIKKIFKKLFKRG